MHIFLVNNQLDAQLFFMYVYFYSLYVSGSHVPIIRRINCTNTSSGICHSVQTTVWCAGLDETAVSSKPAHQTARNMKRTEINIHKNNCASSWLFTRMIPRCTVNRIQKDAYLFVNSPNVPQRMAFQALNGRLKYQNKKKLINTDGRLKRLGTPLMS